jgi:hypothetical protein
MGVGPNYVLHKGLLATGATAYKFGECVVPSADGTKCARATGAAAAVVFVCQEDLDTTRLATGKAVIDVAFLGIVRVLSGAAVAVNAKVANDATARAVTGGAAGTASFGIALTAATAAGQYIDVLLTPGNTM